MNIFKSTLTACVASLSFVYAQPATHSSVIKLYVATFNRAPDSSGLDYWVKSGLSLEEVAMSFFDQPETQALYPANYTNRDFVNAIYNNLFNRNAEEQGLEYWTIALDDQSTIKALFILAVSNGALGDDATILDHKRTMALRFLESGSEDIDIAKKIMEGITTDPASLTTAQDLLRDLVNVGDCTSVVSQNRYINAVMNSLYLWYEELPSIDPSAYTNNDSFLEDLLYKEYDRWSFIIDAETSDQYYKEGKYLGYGYRPQFYDDKVYIQYVHEDSSASKAGLKRGDEIIEINGKTLLEIDSNNLWESIFGEERIGVQGTLKVIIDGSTKVVQLTKELININSILRDDIFTINGKKVGYLLFNSFVATSKAELDQLFAKFKRENIEELIVDIRYNGGGQLSMAQYLASLIGGVHTKDQIFETLRYNDKMSYQDYSYRFQTLDNSLDLSRVYFISTYNTASASESTINSLIPFLEVFTVGSSTHGKPVGMIGQKFCGKYLYPVMFQGYNAADYGDYFSGIPASCSAYDDVSHDLGDSEESMLKATLHLISNDNTACYTETRRRKAPTTSRDILQGFHHQVGAI